MNSVARPIGPGRFLANIALTVLVFAVVGPFAGELAFFVMSAINSGHGLGAGVGAFIISVLIAWPAAFIAGGPAAAVTGLIVAVASRWAAPGPLYALAALAGAITSAVFFYAVLPFSRRLVVSRGLGSFVAGHTRDLVLLALVGAVAALLCTWLTKRWRSA